MGFDADVPLAKPSSYYDVYESAFAAWRNDRVRLLELGVAEGASVLRWLDWFPRGEVAGLDLDPPAIEAERLRLFRGSQADTELLDRIARDCAPEGFDIIIDDASHIGWLTAASFWHLFPKHVKPGGLYAIEDWGTGYFPRYRHDGRKFAGALPPKRITPRATRLKWTARLQHRLGVSLPLPAPPSHQAGMVGVLKQIIDAIAIPDIVRGDPNAAVIAPCIASVEIYPGQVIIHKATD